MPVKRQCWFMYLSFSYTLAGCAFPHLRHSIASAKSSQPFWQVQHREFDEKICLGLRHSMPFWPPMESATSSQQALKE